MVELAEIQSVEVNTTFKSTAKKQRSSVSIQFGGALAGMADLHRSFAVGTRGV